MRLILFLAALFLALGGQPAYAGPWSVTLYGGPVTYTIFTQTLAGKMKTDGGMMGISVDRRLAYLGWGWNLIGEAQAQQFAFGNLYPHSTYPSIGAGLGIEFHQFPWERSVPTAVSFVIGPCYSFGPPNAYFTSTTGSRKSLLNYLAIEFAVSLPYTRKWDAVFRVYHRSGMWGIYSLDADEATSFGLGIRIRI